MYRGESRPDSEQGVTYTREDVIWKGIHPDT